MVRNRPNTRPQRKKYPLLPSPLKSPLKFTTYVSPPRERV